MAEKENAGSLTRRASTKIASAPNRTGGRAKKIWGRMKRGWQIYLMLLPVMVFYILFSYVPMNGIVLAWKEYLPKQGIWGSPGVGWKYFEQFFSEHHSEYDIVHLHAPYIAFLCMPVAAKYGISHRIVHSHATVYAESKGKAVRNRMLWSISQKYITDRIGCSQAAGAFLFGKKDYTVLKNAICCDEYAYNETARNEIRTQYQAKDKLVIGNVGRFSQQKNQMYLVDIFSEIRRIHKDSVLWLVGDGELRPQIEEKIKQLGLINSVKIFGMVDNTGELYQAMDVMVMPSLFEGLPMTGVEAQACGLPCVFSDTITREVDVMGSPFLSLEESKAEWAKTAVRAAGRYKESGKERRSFGKELAEHGFDIRVEAGRLEEMYEEMK